MDAPSWTSPPLPHAAVSVVRGEVTGLVDSIIGLVRDENPGYADVLGGPEGIGIRLGIEQAIRGFIDAVERGERPARETADVWRRLGEAEFQSGRGLEVLRAAFRTGTRAAWRGAAELAAQAGISATLVIALAEAIFVYGDELASDVVEGYLRAQSDEAGERERRRRRLAGLLLDGELHDPEAVERAAQLARWPLPRALAVLAVAADSPIAVTRKLDVDVLAGADGEGAWVILADPDGPGRGAALSRALGALAVDAALGPTVAVREVVRSLRWARRTLALVRAGALPSERPTRSSEHLAGLVVLGDPELAAALVSAQLAALQRLPAAERERLTETLRAWLDHQRQTPAIAAALSVHPQTVRYRVRQLHELLGGALETPEGRFQLALALRAARATGSAPSSEPGDA